MASYARGRDALKVGAVAVIATLAFSALFIAILASFWKGPRTGAILAASGATAALAKLFVPGAWYIVLGGLAGVTLAAATAAPEAGNGG